MKRITSVLVAVLIVLAIGLAGAQDRLKTMPGYEQYQKMSGEIPGSVKLGALTVTWKDGGKAFEYRKDGKLYRYDMATRSADRDRRSAGRRREAGRRTWGPRRGRRSGARAAGRFRPSRPTRSSRRSTATAISG